ncbi:MAG: VWA domain-containing protein [Gemmatimonadetes bacterium]|nr:VWA domain-containing protein [Gemmatimonadota bacterium]
MAYAAEISRQNPSCICFLIDQSGSMADPIAGSAKRKAEFLADAINRILEDLSIRCQKGEEIRDYFDIVTVGYGAQVGPVLAGTLSGRPLVSIGELANNPARVESRLKKVDDGAGSMVEQQVRFPVWIDPVSAGQTPMCAALGQLRQVLEGWTKEHRLSFPPVVLHFTDGASTDGVPSEEASAIRALATSDGNVLLFNIHISDRGGTPIVFPASNEGLPDDFARLLFSMSSGLPPSMAREAAKVGYPATEASKGFVYNAAAEHVVGLLEIGTRPANLR